MIETIITGDLGVNTYLYNYQEDRILIIDPGDDFNTIVNVIDEKGYKPKLILLTHGHFDHIGAVPELRDKYNIPLYIHTADSTFVGNEGQNRHKEMFNSLGTQGNYYFDNYYREINRADVLFNQGDEIGESDLTVIHTPGHSPGSSCFYSIKNNLLFSGDTLFNGGFGRTDFIGGDFNILENSIKELFNLPQNTIVYPGHGSTTTIGNENR